MDPVDLLAGLGGSGRGVLAGGHCEGKQRGRGRRGGCFRLWTGPTRAEPDEVPGDASRWVAL